MQAKWSVGSDKLRQGALGCRAPCGRLPQRAAHLYVERHQRSSMGVLNLFSKRQRRARGEVPDVYVYDKLPNELRVQIVHIVRDAFGEDHYGSKNAEKAYEAVKQALCRE